MQEVMTVASQGKVGPNGKRLWAAEGKGVMENWIEQGGGADFSHLADLWEPEALTITTIKPMSDAEKKECMQSWHF